MCPVWTRTLCQRLVATPCSSGNQVLKPWPIPFGDVDVSEAFNCCASSDDSGTPSQQSQASLYKRSSCCSNNLSKVATTVFSYTCLEASSTYDPVQPAKSNGPNEAVGDGHKDYSRRWRRGGIRSGHRTRRQSSGRGTTSRRHVFSTASSASPSCWSLMSCSLVLRDVSIPTLAHLLTFAAESNLLVFNDTQMITALAIYSNAHYMFGVKHYRGNTLTSGFMHKYHQHSRHRSGILPRFHLCW